ncbi:cytochrome P450 [Gilbertella persicaria]|uniref:cytochrome P450 n=1 Tax=Gilbertella persicaria TaxID=101096 RepID=UPI002220AFD0|nr:cytochrome P450 [Gilbertella persicaria]KAI8091152.1 cytochrome P450 [Gilbertella persicaria]
MIVENVLQVYHQVAERLLPVLKRQSKVSYIGAAILCILASEVYAQLRVPKYLRQFPKVSYFKLLKSLYVNESVFDRNKRLVVPITQQGYKFYTSKMPLSWSLFVTDADIAKTLLLKSDTFPKSDEFVQKLGPSSPAVMFLGKDNVALSNGHTWKRQRKFMNPAFHRAMPVKTFASVMPRLFAVIDENPHDFPAAIRMKNFTLDALGLAGFAFDFQSLTGDPEGWSKTYNVVIRSLFNPWVNVFAKIDFILYTIMPSKRESYHAVIKFNKMLVNMADKRRQEIYDGQKSNLPESEKDLLTLMIEAELREGVTTTSQELRENIALFFLAGHDTTAHTLTFCLYNLAKNKDIQTKLRQEILDVLGDDPCDVTPTLEDLKKMTYLDMVLKENLRKSGPADRILNRVTAEDVELGGTMVPKGIPISVDIVSIHMNPKYWHDPERFIPERFEQGGEYDSHTGMTWLPFSNGARQCIGMNFSLTEQRVVLVMLLKRYEIDVPRDSIHYDKVVYDKPFNFAPADLKLSFTKRY